MLTEKEMIVYTAIKKFIQKKNYSPTIRELTKILNYKSTRTVYYYLQKLKEKNYIFQENKKNRSIIINNRLNEKIIVMNTKKIIEINWGNNTLLFQIKNNYFTEYGILKNDYLIINNKSNIKNNDLGLFIINNQHRIMKYNYIDGFYVLEDNEKEIVYKIKLIGKVVGIYRTGISIVIKNKL